MLRSLAGLSTFERSRARPPGAVEGLAVAVVDLSCAGSSPRGRPRNSNSGTGRSRSGAKWGRPRRLGLPERAGVRSAQARERCYRIVEHFGYLQIDTVAVSGARTHCIVLASRLPGLDAALAETVLAPGVPLFEYWGHEACWLPLSLYPCFAWRRKQYRVHPWCGDVLREHRRLARSIVKRIECEGALRSLDLERAQGRLRASPGAVVRCRPVRVRGERRKARS